MTRSTANRVWGIVITILFALVMDKGNFYLPLILSSLVSYFIGLWYADDNPGGRD